MHLLITGEFLIPHMPYLSCFHYPTTRQAAQWLWNIVQKLSSFSVKNCCLTTLQLGLFSITLSFCHVSVNGCISFVYT